MPVIDSILTGIITSILSSPKVSVPQAKVPEVAAQVSEVIKEDKTIAVVPVKSAAKSKINIFNSAILVTVLGYFGINIPQTPEEWAAAIAGVALPLVNIVLKTFFTKTVTASSVK